MCKTPLHDNPQEIENKFDDQLYYTHVYLNPQEIENTFDDQLYYTHVYLDPEFRERHKIQLDGTSKIFHNLHGAEKEIDWGFGSKRLANLNQGTLPQVLHGNGPTKILLNRFGNYYPKAFDPTIGYKGKCMICDEKEGTINVEDTENLPTILTTMFIIGNFNVISVSFSCC